MVKIKKTLVDKLKEICETISYNVIDVKVDNHMWVKAVSITDCEIIDGIDGLSIEDITDVRLSKSI